MSEQKRRAYVTGMGVVSCLGVGVDNFRQALLAGESGLRPLTRFDLEGSPYTVGGEVTGLDLVPFVESRVSMAAQMAGAAAAEAIQEVSPADRESLGIVLSSNFGPYEVLEAIEDGEPLPPGSAGGDSFFARGPLGWDSDYVAERIGARGQQCSVSLSCSSGNAAIDHARRLITSGSADMVLAGGYDSIQKMSWAGLSCLRVMTTDKEGGNPKVRPFDANRSGTLFSEGAGMVLLEEGDHARRRGATPWAEVCGAASNNNAFHMTHADKEGRATAEVIRMALDEGELDPAEVDFINAHGTGTKLNDVIETRAFEAVFGKRALDIPVTSIKGGLGHGMGAASALEAVSCVLSLCDGVIPPTLHGTEPDPEIGLDVVRETPREGAIEVAVNNSAGIGGSNSAVVFRRTPSSG